MSSQLHTSIAAAGQVVLSVILKRYQSQAFATGTVKAVLFHLCYTLQLHCTNATGIDLDNASQRRQDNYIVLTKCVSSLY